MDRLLKEAELAQNNVDKAEQKASTIYTTLNSARALGSEIESLYNTIPFQLNIVTTTIRSNMVYNDRGQLTDYTELTTQKGIAKELAWKAMDKAGDLYRWANELSVQTNAKADALYAEAATAEAEGRTEDAQALKDEADRLRAEAHDFQEIAYLAQTASQKAEAFLNALKAEDQNLIETTQSELLQAQDALGDKVEDFARAKEGELDQAREILTTLQRLAYETEEAAKKAEDYAKIVGRYEVVRDTTYNNAGNIVTKTTDTYELNYKGEKTLIQTVTVNNEYNTDNSLHSQTTLTYKYVDGEAKLVAKEVIEHAYDGGRCINKTTYSYAVNTYGTEILVGKSILATEYNALGQIVKETNNIFGITGEGSAILAAREVTTNTYETQGNIAVQTKELYWIERDGTARLAAKHIITNEYDLQGNLIHQSTMKYALISE